MHRENYLATVKERANPDLFNTIIARYFQKYVGHCGEVLGVINRSNSEYDFVQPLHEWARHVVLLATYCEPDMIRQFNQQMTDQERQDYREAGNQFDRFLWLYHNAPIMFDDACDLLSNTVIRDERSFLPCTYFSVFGPSLIADDSVRIANFRKRLGNLLLCEESDVAVDRLDTLNDLEGGGSSGHEFTITYNQLVAAVDVVLDGRVGAQKHIQTKKMYLTYYEDAGVIEVYAPYRVLRERIAQLFSRVMLGDDILCRILTFSFQQFSQPTILALCDASVKSAKVISLTYMDGGRESTVSIPKDYPVSIYEQCHLGKPIMQKNGLLIKVVIAVTIDNSQVSSHDIKIDLCGKSSALIQTVSREERSMCHRLLRRWGILLEGKSYDESNAWYV